MPTSRIFMLLFSSSFYFFIGMGALQAQDCNCEKFIYLNEVNEDATLKFSINPDGSLTEVLNPITGGHWQDNVTFAPHGAYMGPNGYVYVGNFDGVGGVDRYDCNGTLVEEDFIPIASGNGTDGTSGYASNLYVVDNVLYLNTWVGSGYPEGGVFAYDLCSGELLGLYIACDGGGGWGFHIDENTNMIHFILGGRGIYSGDLDTWLGPLDGSGPCIPETIDETDVNRGIITDENGCIYVRDFNGSPQYMKKWCPDGAGGYTLAWQTDIITAAAAAGFPSTQGGDGGYGLTYCEDNGYIYTAGNDDDCVSVYDATTGEYVIQGYPNPGGTFAKEISLARECCITNTNVPPTTVNYCEGEAPDELLLYEFLPCEGVVCGGTWTETTDPDSAFEFDSCDNSVVPLGTGGCATYEFSQSCGPATINVEICVAGESSCNTITVIRN